MSAKPEAHEPVAHYLAMPQLLQHFDRVAQATGGVAHLRELILTLAVRGKLLPQNLADEPASVLLERIHEEKARLVKERKIWKEKPPAAISDQVKPFELPEGWEWVRLNELLTKIGAGSTPLGGKEVYVSEGIKFLRSQNVWHNGLRLTDVAYIKPETHLKMSATTVFAGDILFNITGASIGRCAVVPVAFDEANVSQHVTIIRPALPTITPFLHLVLISPHVQQTVMDVQVGVSREGLSIGKLGQFLVPIPPLSEQSRIVARVKELMALCDALEEKGHLEAAQHERLAGALFDALANSASAEEAAENWQRIAAHFDLLLDRPAAVDRLEQAILQLAVRGRLVPQNSADEPASILLDRLRSEKNRLVSEGKIRREKPLKESTQDEDSLVPAGWATVTFPELCSIGGGATPSKAKANYWSGNIPWVSPKDMKVDFIADAQDHVSQIALEETSLTLIPKDSLLIVVRGMILAHSFPVGITQAEVTINQDMKSLTPVFPALTPYLALICKGFKSEILELVERSSHGTCKLESDKLFSFRFGLPPLAEQSRIVARVKELRALCAQLRQRLADSQQTQSRLAEALLQKAAA